MYSRSPGVITIDINDAIPLRVQLLGPVRAWAEEQDVGLGAPRRRAVFAMLAMRANRVVSRQELVDGIWGSDPPASVVNGIHIYVAGLRRALEPGRGRWAQGQVLRTSGTGYVLTLEPGQPDAVALDQHLVQARAARAAGDLASAARSLEKACALWQAAPLGGIPGPWAETERERLTELWLTVIEENTEVMLARGEHAQAAAELAKLVRGYPLREKFASQLMIARYRCGRQADALAVFAQTRHILVTELGIEPGPELQRLQAQMLAGDEALLLPAAAGPGTEGPRAPAQLPADVDAFVGREAELAELGRFMAASPAVIITAVSGTAGVGKTALALRWAHLVRSRFPDGQLYANLRGYDLDQPITADEVLARFLRTLGYAGDIPADTDELAAAYRTLADGRRMLVVLDNAATAEQVRPLLPGSPTCMVVVTSRDSLAGLVARHGARRLQLDLLPHDDAVGLLRELIGDRVDAEPGAAVALARQCAGLPLALRVAAELATAHPAMTLAGLVASLTDEQRRLDVLDAAGDPRTAIRGVFSWSYRHLPAEAARVFRLIGLHPAADIDEYAVAALAAIGLDESRRTLGLLARAHLVRHEHGGRYSLHDLLRGYAAQLAAAQDSAAERRSAQARLLDYYLAATAAAVDALHPAERSLRPPVAADDESVLALVPRDGEEALAWLEAERVTLGDMIAHAAAHGWHSHAIRLAAILFRYLDTCGYYSEAIAIHGHAQAAARLSGDIAAEATALSHLGVAAWRQNRFGSAATILEQALARFREAADRAGEARALGNLGLIYWRQDCYAQSASYQELALELFRELGHTAGEAQALNNLGVVRSRQERYSLAASYQEQALTLFRELGERTGEARALNNLGEYYERQGAWARAADNEAWALALFRQMGDRFDEANTLTNLSVVYELQGDGQRAASLHEQALALHRELGDFAGEAETLNRFGGVRLATARPGAARALFAAALVIADRIGNKFERARAHEGLGRCHEDDGDLSKARYHWQRAVGGYTELELPDAARRVHERSSSAQVKARS